VSTPNGDAFAHSLHAFVGTFRDIHSTAKLKHCRGHVVMLFPPPGKISTAANMRPGNSVGDTGRGASQSSCSPLDSELFSVVVEGVRNSIRAKEHRLGGKHHALDRAGFFQFRFSQLLNVVQFQRERCRVHSLVRKGVLHRRGNSGGSTNSDRAAAFRSENGGRCFLTQLLARTA
jgi:hypothetical protein